MTKTYRKPRMCMKSQETGNAPFGKEDLVAAIHNHHMAFKPFHS